MSDSASNKKAAAEPLRAEMGTAHLASIGQNVLDSIADAQRYGCASCLRKSDDYVVTVGSVFDLRKSPDAVFQFSALCGECLNVALDFGKTKRG